MTIKSKYNFREYTLGSDFAKEKVKDFKGLIETGISFTVVSMPGVGVSYFLKYLTSFPFAYFIYVDLYNLPTLNQHEFYRMFLRDLGGNPDGKSDEQVFIESKEILKNLSQKHEKIVIIFSRFDQLKKDFDENFLSNLQSLTNIALGKIVLIFTAVKPLYEISPDATKGGNLSFYSKILYFTPLSKNDLKKLFTLDHTIKYHPEIDQMIDASGGHNQLLHIFINSHKKQNLLLDKFVRLQLRDLYDYLDYDQKKQVQAIAMGKTVSDPDEYLLGVGYMTLQRHPERSLAKGERVEGSRFKLFSPVLEEFIKTNMPKKLPVKERLLFKLLQNNIGKVVSKDEIFKTVWPDNEAGATDWALDALIYRLRKSSFMKANGYIIESYKKVGYSLIKI